MGGVRRVDILLWVSVPQSPSALPRVTSPIHLGQRQAELPEGAGVGGSPAYSRKPLGPLRWASKARPGAHLIVMAWWVYYVDVRGPALHRADTLVFVGEKGTVFWVSGEEPGIGTEWPWVLCLRGSPER